jgi:hypothetical protein
MARRKTLKNSAMSGATTSGDHPATKEPHCPPRAPRRRRLERVERLAAAQTAQAAGRSQRQAAAEAGVARSTLRDWEAAQAAQEGQLPAALIAFFHTPEGAQGLRRWVFAAHFVLTLLSGAGVRLVCRFLELTGLSAVVGASYGTQHRLNKALETAVGEVAQDERRRLAEGMAVRRVSLGEDETFHPQICLVGLDLVSDVIFLEQYASDRPAATWTHRIKTALDGLAVEVIQGTSDEAKGLIRHVREAFGAQHSPDRFHVQRELSKATGLTLARQVEQAQTALDQAQAQRQAAREAQAARTQEALTAWVQAQQDHEQAPQRQTEAQEVIREVSALYPPCDLRTGLAQSAARVTKRLETCWTRLRRIAEAADLSARARARREKARRVTAQRAATVTCFFTTLCGSPP